jgi:thioredoxin-like negative regulator of GroEL
MIAEYPTDLESKFAYAKYLNENGRHKDSIDQLFIIMIQNKYWNDN